MVSVVFIVIVFYVKYVIVIVIVDVFKFVCCVWFVRVVFREKFIN